MHPLFIIRTDFLCSVPRGLVKLYLLEVEHLLGEPINLLMKPEVTGPSSRMNEFLPLPKPSAQDDMEICLLLERQ